MISKKADERTVTKSTCEDLDKQFYENKPLCLACASENIVIYWEPKYNGFRGTCKDCNTNWAES